MQLKKQAKPYKFLKFEMQYIYPLVIKDYHPEADISSHAGSDHGLGASAHPDEEEAKQRQGTALSVDVFTVYLYLPMIIINSCLMCRFRWF